jgi:hypothetical protein
LIGGCVAAVAERGGFLAAVAAKEKFHNAILSYGAESVNTFLKSHAGMPAGR